MKIRVLNILEQTMADGPGFRTAIYCAGCKHACKGCHNPQSWDFNAGKWMEVEELLEIIKADDLSDVSFSGGDPFYQVEGFTELARRIKEETNKTIWCWTGFTLEEIQASAQLSQLLPYLDVLVDGPFILEQRDTDLLFREAPTRGSSIFTGTLPRTTSPGRLPWSLCVSSLTSFRDSAGLSPSTAQSGTGLPRQWYPPCPQPGRWLFFVRP